MLEVRELPLAGSRTQALRALLGKRLVHIPLAPPSLGHVNIHTHRPSTRSHAQAGPLTARPPCLPAPLPYPTEVLKAAVDLVCTQHNKVGASLGGRGFGYGVTRVTPDTPGWKLCVRHGRQCHVCLVTMSHTFNSLPALSSTQDCCKRVQDEQRTFM